MCNNPNLDLVNTSAHTKFGLILSICSQDFERNEIMADGRNDRQKDGMTDNLNPV